MEAPSDNSGEKNLENLSRRTGGGVVLDIGTGDGRFVYRSAAANPDKFFIGIDANTKPLEKISMKATRKPAKGGLPNVLFIQAAVEDLPEELDDSADEIHIHFPWGSLLAAVASGDENILKSLKRISAPECVLEIVIGIDEQRDRTEIERLNLPPLSDEYLKNNLIPKYEAAGFELLESGVLDTSAWSELETSWARKLQSGADRKVIFLIFQATVRSQIAPTNRSAKLQTLPDVFVMPDKAKIEIIAYDEKYARDAVKMWRDSKEKAIGQKDVHSFEEHLDYLRSVLTKENKVYLAIDKKTETVVGLMAICGSRLNQLYIHNDYQRSGIGTRLLNLAKELSPGKLRLFTFEANKKARAFYEKHGFKIIGRGFENEENLPDIKYEWINNNGI